MKSDIQMRKGQRGSMAVWIILAAIAIAAAGGYIYYLKRAGLTPAQIQQVKTAMTDTSGGTLSSNVCDYLPPALVSKYVVTPVQLDTSAPSSFGCAYQTVGARPGQSDVVFLFPVETNLSSDVVDVMAKDVSAGRDFKDDSSIGFTAWYVLPSGGKTDVVFYLASQHTIMALDVTQPDQAFNVNLQAAENLAKAIKPQLP